MPYQPISMTLQIELKTKEQVEVELRKLIIKIKRELPKEGSFREILMDKRKNIHVYIENIGDVTKIRAEDTAFKIMKGKEYLIDIDIDIERAVTYSYIFVCDEIVAYNKTNAKVATVGMRPLKLKAL
jgi:protein-arginine kinase